MAVPILGEVNAHHPSAAGTPRRQSAPCVRDRSGADAASALDTLVAFELFAGLNDDEIEAALGSQDAVLPKCDVLAHVDDEEIDRALSLCIPTGGRQDELEHSRSPIATSIQTRASNSDGGPARLVLRAKRAPRQFHGTPPTPYVALSRGVELPVVVQAIFYDTPPASRVVVSRGARAPVVVQAMLAREEAARRRAQTSVAPDPDVPRGVREAVASAVAWAVAWAVSLSFCLLMVWLAV